MPRNHSIDRLPFNSHGHSLNGICRSCWPGLPATYKYVCGHRMKPIEISPHPGKVLPEGESCLLFPTRYVLFQPRLKTLLKGIFDNNEKRNKAFKPSRFHSRTFVDLLCFPQHTHTSQARYTWRCVLHGPGPQESFQCKSFKVIWLRTYASLFHSSEERPQVWQVALLRTLKA